MQSMRRLISTAMAAAATIFIVINSGGCAEWSTYPTVEVKAGTMLARPEARTVVSVMAASVSYTQEHLTQGQDLAINLPWGAPAEAYDKVFAKIGSGRPMQADGEPAIHLKEVRTRGMHAEADVIYPRADGLNQLTTLYLECTLFETYSVKDFKAWQLRSVAAPTANYVAPLLPLPASSEENDDPASKQPTIDDRLPTATTDADVPRDTLVPG